MNVKKAIRDLLFVIPGKNFSGKTDYLKSLAIEKKDNEYPYLYLGELPSNYITGIFPTVREEVNLHRSKAGKQTKENIDKLFNVYDFNKHLDKNPFNLSGGEQVILSILSNLLLEPSILAIDSTLEQLSQEWRVPLLKAIQEGVFCNSTIYLADNRIEEYELESYTSIQPTLKEQDYKWKFLPPVLEYYLGQEEHSHVIQLKSLTFAYNKNDCILERVNIELHPGKIYHLKGSNGVGKSTFAKILTGILKVNKQQLKVDGKEFDAYKYPGKLVGYCFQNPDEQLFSSSVEKEILRALKNEEEPYTKRRETFIKMFGLENVRKCHPAEMPFTMRKRIALAATLAMDRPWYILDEPTLGQDDQFIEFLIELLSYLSEKGKGIILISHSETFVKQIKLKSLYLKNKLITF